LQFATNQLAFWFLLSVPTIQLGTPSRANDGPIEVRYSKHVISYLSGVPPALVGPLSTFISTVEHRGGSPLGLRIPFSHVLLRGPESEAIFRLFFWV
jgi:hypothetical protein